MTQAPNVFTAILAGGSGTRLWPLSRKTYPKQFLQLFGHHSLLQSTFCRGRSISDRAPIVIGADEHRFLLHEQLAPLGLNAGSIILEPSPRNTSASAAIAALRVQEEDPDAIVVLLPADHWIEDEGQLLTAIQDAVLIAAEGYIVTIGIKPTHAETGFGYIELGSPLTIGQARGNLVRAFTEKPHLELAQTFLQTGDHLWNGGMFVFKPSVLLGELKAFEPKILDAAERALANAKFDLGFTRLDHDFFSQAPAKSIDYAVMEKTSKSAVVGLSSKWGDLGSWKSVWEAGEADQNQNVVTGDVVLRDVSNSLVRSDGKLVAVLGLRDVAVISTKDAILVTSIDASQGVKSLVEQLGSEGRKEINHGEAMHRPWGAFQSIVQGDRFQVKQITVRPGASISLQMHHHRAEHWIVVSGTAKVTRGDQSFLLQENESTFIPLGTKHRLENPGLIPLQIIEVQSGSYLGEDDIVRFEDLYGREKKL